mgnify:CR=1 FL=1
MCLRFSVQLTAHKLKPITLHFFRHTSLRRVIRRMPANSFSCSVSALSFAQPSRVSAKHAVDKLVMNCRKPVHASTLRNGLQHFLSHNTIRSYYGTITNGYSSEDSCLVAYPHIVANDYSPFRVEPAFCWCNAKSFNICCAMIVVGFCYPLISFPPSLPL